MDLFKTITGPQEGKAFTAHSFLEYLRKSAPHWWEDAKDVDDCPWVFRGQSNAVWPLIPSAARPAGDFDTNYIRIVKQLKREALENAPGAWKKLTPAEKESSSRVLAFWQCLFAFEALAQDLGYSVDKTNITLPKLSEVANYVAPRKANNIAQLGNDNKPYYSGNMRQALPDEASTPMENIALAQHHGVPTFMLDWSERPLVATHFAANGSEGRSDIAIWALNVQTLEYILDSHMLKSKGEAPIRVFRPPKSTNQFLSAQSGLLNYFTNSEAAWDDSGKYRALDDQITTWGEDIMQDITRGAIGGEAPGFIIGEILQKITLPADQVTELQQLLRREGITKAHMMPTLDNVAETAIGQLLER